MPNFTTPGVEIIEITGPGVITGVGTSTAAFIGPAAQGPLFTPTVITTFDDFVSKFGRASDGWPYLVFLGRTYYLGYGVQGFFENGGTRAVIVRVGSARAASWSVVNGAGKEVFRLEAVAEGVVGNGYTITLSAYGLSAADAPKLAYPTATIAAPAATDPPRQVTVTYTSTTDHRFIVGDIVAFVNSNNTVAGRNRVIGVSVTAPDKAVVTLESALPTGTLTSMTLKMARINNVQREIRIGTPSSDIQAGSLVQIEVPAGTRYFAIVESTDADGFVFLRSPFQKENGDPIAASSSAFIDISTSPGLRNLDFAVKVTSLDGKQLDEQRGLSLDPFHTGYVFRRNFQSVRILPPDGAPDTRVFAQLQPTTGTATQNTPLGVEDNPSGVGLSDYNKALDALDDVDDVNIVCVPDAATFATAAGSPVQQAVITRCLKKKDRIAVLDVPAGLPPANDPSALSHRFLVSAPGGFAALYYPWLLVPEPVEPRRPRPLIPQSIPVPPSGHVAGVYARIDQTLGVHHPPANTEVRGVMGLERVISDREQGLINLDGVNALRIFPGDGRVVVWGARTTGHRDESDWRYVNVRRLMLYIEESIEEGIRWAVFKPNDRPLWQSLKRTIGDFLERVWKDGGLVGKTREQAYQVRIDEGLNTPADIKNGRLYIEIRVAPVRPAEFIIVRIGLWDGGAEVAET